MTAHGGGLCQNLVCLCSAITKQVDYAGPLAPLSQCQGSDTSTGFRLSYTIQEHVRKCLENVEAHCIYNVLFFADGDPQRTPRCFLVQGNYLWVTAVNIFEKSWFGFCFLEASLSSESTSLLYGFDLCVILS